MGRKAALASILA